MRRKKKMSFRRKRRRGRKKMPLPQRMSLWRHVL